MAARLNLLADASQAFSEATGDYDRLLAVIAGCLVKSYWRSVRYQRRQRGRKGAGAGLRASPRSRDEIALAQRLLVAHPIPVGEGVSGGVAGSGEPLFVPCVSLSAFVASALPAYRELLERVNVGSLIIVPMLCRGKVVGVASSWRRTPRPSSPAPSSTSTVGTCSYERAHAGACGRASARDEVRGRSPQQAMSRRVMVITGAGARLAARCRPTSPASPTRTSC